MKNWRLRRAVVLVLVATMLVVQPTAQLVRAQEVAVATFEVSGVSGATLRAEPNGSSAALTIVTAGSKVTLAGPDVLTGGIVWRQVRTAEGMVGYLPAGLLVQMSGPPVPTPAPVASAPDAGVPASSVDAAPVNQPTNQPIHQSEATASAGLPQTAAPPSSAASSGPPTDGVSQTAARGSDPTPSPVPTPAAARTTVERRRGQDITVTHIATERAPNGQEMGAGRIVVRFLPAAGQTARTDAHRSAGAATTESTRLPETIVAKVPPSSVAQALAAYRARPDVAWAEPDYVRRVTLTPNDTDFGQQWNMGKIGAPAAWDITTGTTAPKIAILDCGVYTESSLFQAPDGQYGHPDLRGKVVNEQNFSDATTGADDWCDHGTLMAGIAAANTNNAKGVAGVAFNAKLMNGKVLDDNGEGYDSWVANGIVWAADNGAGVISMSLGGEGGCNSTLQTAIDYAWNRGAVIVAAAGNGGADGVGDPLPEAPGSCNHVIPVGAINRNDERPGFSNYNANPGAGAVVPVAAPGVDVYSTDFRGLYSFVSGTSPSTPHVAGVAALVKAVHNESNAAIVNRIIAAADPIVGTGTLWANGRLDAPAAIAGVACSPRPNIQVTSAPQGSYLKVTITAMGLGNVLRYVQVNGTAGTMVNTTLIFPGAAPYTAGKNVTPLQWQGASTYVPAGTTSKTEIHLIRQAAGSAATVPMKVQDICGTWTSLVGGGTGAGF